MNLKATNKTETNKYELEVEISAEDFSKALSEVAKTEGKKMSVPGFRKGHAPRSVIEKMYGENVFFEAAVDKLYRPAMQDAIEASGLEVIAVSNADVTSVSRENGIELKLTVVVKPLIIIITQTAPPVHMVPSTVRSAMSRTRNVRYTPIAIIPQIRPWAAAPGSAMIKFAICMSLSSCMRDLFAGACLKKHFRNLYAPLCGIFCLNW